MAKADRLERMDARRAELEAEYHDVLHAALTTAAAGTWGLFDHKPDRAARARTAQVIAELSELAAEIDERREALMMDPFTLHHDFIAARGPVPSNALGEPKQAQAWLDRLAGVQHGDRG